MKNDRILNLIDLNFFEALKLHFLFYSNDLASWHGFPDITHIEDDNAHKSYILNLIQLKFVRAYPSLKTHILLYGNVLAIWQFSRYYAC